MHAHKLASSHLYKYIHITLCILLQEALHLQDETKLKYSLLDYHVGCLIQKSKQCS